MATQEFDNEMRGVLFPEKNKKSDRAPDMTGNVTINGETYRLAAWARTSRNQQRYLSIAVTVPEDRPAEASQSELGEDTEGLPGLGDAA